MELKHVIFTFGIEMGGLNMYGIKEMSRSKDKYEKDFSEVVSKQDGSHATPLAAFFVGGKYHGLYMTHKELKPMIDGYLSPMLDGGRLRYETQEIYDLMFD